MEIIKDVTYAHCNSILAKKIENNRATLRSNYSPCELCLQLNSIENMLCKNEATWEFTKLSCKKLLTEQIILKSSMVPIIMYVKISYQLLQIHLLFHVYVFPPFSLPLDLMTSNSTQNPLKKGKINLRQNTRLLFFMI